MLLEHHAKGFDDLSEKFWDKVNALLAKVLVERAQGKLVQGKLYTLQIE